MRRTPFVLSLTAALALVGAVPSLAQQSTTRGFTMGAHVSGASLQVEDGDRSNGGGGGLFFGYGFNRSFQLFLQLDGAQFDVDDAEVEGDWTMAHGDLGVRYHFANSLRSWVPYLQAAFTGRVVRVEDATVDGTTGVDVSFNGGALSLGGGIMFYFNQTFAADIQLMWSGGQFTEIEVDNVTVAGLEIDANSSRFDIGILWWP